MAVLHSLPTHMWETKPLSLLYNLFRGIYKKIPRSFLLAAGEFLSGIRQIWVWEEFFLKFTPGQTGNSERFPACWIRTGSTGNRYAAFFQEFASVIKNEGIVR